MNLCQGRSSTFEEESQRFFQNLFSQVDDDEGPITVPRVPSLGPDMSFVVGNETLKTHSYVMQVCHGLTTARLLKTEEEGESAVNFTDSSPVFEVEKA